MRGSAPWPTDILTIADAGHVRTITLNRPDKKNALSGELSWAIVDAVDAAALDDNVWVVAITGLGRCVLRGAGPHAGAALDQAVADDGAAR